MVVKMGISVLLGGMTTGVVISQINLPPGGYGIIIGIFGALGTVIGALATWLTNRKKLNNHEADSLRSANEQLRSDMFQQIGALKLWSESQDKRLEELEVKRDTERELKHKCLQDLMQAQFEIAELESVIIRNTEYITKLEAESHD